MIMDIFLKQRRHDWCIPAVCSYITGISQKVIGVIMHAYHPEELKFNMIDAYKFLLDHGYTLGLGIMPTNKVFNFDHDYYYSIEVTWDLKHNPAIISHDSKHVLYWDGYILIDPSDGKDHDFSEYQITDIWPVNKIDYNWKEDF